MVYGFPGEGDEEWELVRSMASVSPVISAGLDIIFIAEKGV